MTTMPKMGYKKRRRMTIGILGLIVLSAVTLLIFYSLDGNAFKQPADVNEIDLTNGKQIRLGGLVEMDSVSKLDDGLTTQFMITDCKAEIMVRYTGILPALFREGQGVLTDGRFDSEGTLIASEVLAKHDETYQAPGMEVESDDGQCRHPDSEMLENEMSKIQ